LTEHFLTVNKCLLVYFVYLQQALTIITRSICTADIIENTVLYIDSSNEKFGTRLVFSESIWNILIKLHTCRHPQHNCDCRTDKLNAPKNQYFISGMELAYLGCLGKGPHNEYVHVKMHDVA